MSWDPGCLASATGEQAPDVLSSHLSLCRCPLSSWPPEEVWVSIYISQVWFPPGAGPGRGVWDRKWAARLTERRLEAAGESRVAQTPRQEAGSVLSINLSPVSGPVQGLVQGIGWREERGMSRGVQRSGICVCHGWIQVPGISSPWPCCILCWLHLGGLFPQVVGDMPTSSSGPTSQSRRGKSFSFQVVPVKVLGPGLSCWLASRASL